MKRLTRCDFKAEIKIWRQAYCIFFVDSSDFWQAYFSYWENEMTGLKEQ